MYQLSIDVSGESVDEMLAGLETMMHHQLAALAEAGEADARIAEESGEVVLGVTGDRADVTAMLCRAPDEDTQSGGFAEVANGVVLG